MRLILVVLGFLLVVRSQVCTSTEMLAKFDWHQKTPKKGMMHEMTCNKDTQIDFTFPQQASGSITVVQQASQSSYTVPTSNTNDQITLQFLNRQGLNSSYKLRDISLSLVANSRITIDNYPATGSITSELSLTYINDKLDQTVVVSIPLIAAYTTTGGQEPYIIKKSDAATAGFREFVKNFNNQTDRINNLASLKIFNSIEYGMFYTQFQKNGNNCKVNYLVSRFVFEIDDANLAANSTYTGYVKASQKDFQADTGDFLCYGSNTNLGTFQTHMRDNYALWAAWFSVFLFWTAVLYGDNTTINCFDKRFEENKMTCWSFYSLFHLAHEQFFTRLLRSVPQYISFCFQGLICAILYCHIGHIYTDATTIPWFAVIAWVCSIPLQFVFGMFTNRVYSNTLQKYMEKKKIKALFDKEGDQAHVYEENVDECQSKIFESYYWMYVFAVTCFISFWTLAINRLQQIPRERYDEQNKYFIGALLVAWALDVLISEPLMTLAFGNTRWYRYRPYFYDYKLGEIYKELQG